MPAIKLTVKTINELQPVVGKNVLVMDSEIPGFGVKVTSTGKKTYFFQYRLGGRSHTTQRFKLGDVAEDFPATKAREEALQLKAQVRRGIDPLAEKRKQAAEHLRSKAQSFENVLDKYYELRLKQNRCGAEVKAAIEREFKNILLVPISHVERAEVSRVVNSISARGAPYSANRTLSYIKTFFRWSLGHGYIDTDPTYAIPKPFAGETARDRVLNPKEIYAMWNCWSEIGWPFGDALKVLLQTAQRRDEVGGMRWADIDMENNIWLIPSSFTKNKQPHQIPILPSTKEIILRQPYLGEYVFTTNGKSPICGWSKTKHRIENMLEAENICISDWRFHDLRRTAASNLGDLGFADSDIGLLLNHQSRGVTAIYNRSNHMVQKLEMLTKWNEKLDEILNDDGNKQAGSFETLDGGNHGGGDSQFGADLQEGIY